MLSKSIPAACAMALASIVLYSAASTLAAAAPMQAELCPRAAPGSLVEDPKDLRSQDGVLKVDLDMRNERYPDGSVRYCYLLNDGTQSPTLRLKPGDELVLTLHNRLAELGTPTPLSKPVHAPHSAEDSADPCGSGAMTATATNLYFHGLSVPPLCHQNDVLRTSIPANGAPFEYRFHIPESEPPGLYWYHPDIQGLSSRQVLGGASGALIVEGIERAVPELAGLPERVLVIRDQDLSNPKASPSAYGSAVQAIIDRDDDDSNPDGGGGRPAKDLSVNFVPVPYPDFPPATLRMKPNERQLWRVLNASAVTYLNLAALYMRGPHFRPQWIGVVAIDGVPLNLGGGPTRRTVEWRNSVVVPPGARVEFIMVGPPAGVPGLLVTTGVTGTNDPDRVLASIESSEDAPSPRSTLAQHPGPLLRSALPWIGSVTPTHVRELYFSERALNPAEPAGKMEFYMTVDGETPSAFNPASAKPNIVVHQGDVEDWVIENRSPELHAFHIHEVHFQLLEWQGLAVNEPFLRDTINVPFRTPGMQGYPSIKIRIDFRDPDAVGTFVYHCDRPDHKDAGMMGVIEVLPVERAAIAPSARAPGGAVAPITPR